MDFKMLFSHWNEDTGISEAMISCKYGTFIGHAYLNPEDKKYASRFLGCAIAEYRAYIEALKVKIAILDTKLSILLELESRFEDLKETEYNSPEWKALRTLIKVKNNEKNTIIKKINTIEQNISKAIENRIAEFEKNK